MLLSLDSIINCNDLPIEEFDVPEWGGKIGLKLLTGGQREEIESLASIAQASKSTHAKGMKFLVLSFAIVGEGGGPLFSKANLENLANKSSAVIERLFDRVVEVNGLSKKSKESLSKN